MYIAAGLLAAVGAGVLASRALYNSVPKIEEGFIDSPQSFYIEDRPFMNSANAELRTQGQRMAGLSDESALLATHGTERQSDRILRSAARPHQSGGQTSLARGSYTQLTGQLPNQHVAAKLTSGPYSDADFLARPEFKAAIPPRMYGGDYNSELRGSLPAAAMMANPRGPMDLEPGYLPAEKMIPAGYAQQIAGDIRENYSTTDYQSIPQYMREQGAARTQENAENAMNRDYAFPVESQSGKTDFASMAKLGQPVQSAGGMPESEINEDIYAKYLNPLDYTNPQDVLPSDDMSSVAYGKLPSDPNTYVYDRLIVANQRRRNLEGADWIRGDLPIAPDNRGWFQVSNRPHLDLRQGAVGWQIGPGYNTMVESRDLAISSARADENVQVQRFH